MHKALFAERTLVKVEPGKSLYALLNCLTLPLIDNHFRICLHLQCSRTAAVYTVPADLHKPARQDMQAKPSEKLHTRERNRFLFCTVSVILEHKGYAIIVDVDDPLIGNCHTMRVLSQVLHHMFWLTQRRFAMYH